VSRYEARVIRFNCPHCERHYELPDALAKLPLVCKQCGQRLTPPEPTPEPPPVAKPQAAAPAKPAPVPTKAQAPPEGGDVLVAKADSTPDIDFDIPGPTAASLSDAARTRPPVPGSSQSTRPAEAEPGPAVNLDLLPKPAPKPVAPWKPAPQPTGDASDEDKSDPTLLPFVADAVVFVLLVVGGLLLGEMAVRKPTGEILAEAGSAAKFPPIDLLVWAAPAVCFALVYILLGKRDLSVGAWIRRRKAS
jgi:hypothetical protein